MNKVQARLNSSESWTLADDKDLLSALQDLSGSLLSSIDKLNGSLSDLETAASNVGTSVSNASNHFRQLAQTQFIEQRIEQVSGTAPRSSEPSTSAAAATITSANYKQVVYPKYREALKLAVQAFREPVHHPSADKPLPHIFGSPEYLQDANFGLGGQAPSGPSQPASGLKASASGFRHIPDAEDDVEHGQQALALPDFRSMLEAALQGDLSTLPSLAEDTEPVSAHVGAFGQVDTAAAEEGCGIEAHLQGVNQAESGLGAVHDAGTSIDPNGEVAKNLDSRETQKRVWTPAGDGEGWGKSSMGLQNEYAEESKEVFQSPGEVVDSLEELLKEQAHLFSEDELGLLQGD